MSMCKFAVKTTDAMNTHVDLSPSWQVKYGRTKGMGQEKDMALEKRHGTRRKGHGPGKKGHGAGPC